MDNAQVSNILNCSFKNDGRFQMYGFLACIQILKRVDGLFYGRARGAAQFSPSVSCELLQYTTPYGSRN